MFHSGFYILLFFPPSLLKVLYLDSQRVCDASMAIVLKYGSQFSQFCSSYLYSLNLLLLYCRVLLESNGKFSCNSASLSNITPCNIQCQL